MLVVTPMNDFRVLIFSKLTTENQLNLYTFIHSMNMSIININKHLMLQVILYLNERLTL